MASIMKLRD